MHIGACLESVRHGRGWRLGVTLAELGTRLIAKRLENHDRQCGFDSRSHRPRHSTPRYPIVRRKSKTNEHAFAANSAMLPLLTRAEL
jgi:hypothetical protein